MKKIIIAGIMIIVALLNSCEQPLPDNWVLRGYELTYVSVGSYSLMLDSGNNLWVSGMNNGLFGGGWRNRILPLQIIATDVIAAYNSGIHTMILKSDNTLWIRGYVWSSRSEVRFEAEFVKILDDVIDMVTTGNRTLFAIRSDNTLWAYGENRYGQMGDGTTEGKAKFVKIMDDVKAVSGSSRYTMVLRKDGTLLTTGRNNRGQLGDGTTEDRAEFMKIMDNVVSISAGHEYSMAIMNDGSLWGWGYSYFGQIIYLGYVDREDAYLSKPVRIMEDVIDVSTSLSLTFAIKNDNSLWVWGSNIHGISGVGRTEQGDMVPLTMLMEDVVMISTGGTQSMAVTSNGDLWGWGANRDGALGGGPRLTINEPTLIIAAGQE